MSLLTKASNFGPIKWLIGKAAGKARLWLEYVIIAALVAALGFALSTWLQSRQLEKNILKLSNTVGGLSGTVQQQAAINLDQSAAIQRLNELRVTDDKAIQGLRKLLGHNSRQDIAVRQKIAELEKTNADAKQILDAHVPAGLSCLLDDTPCPATVGSNESPSGAAAAGADGTVHRP